MRDEKNRSLLEADGWNVVVVWECELKKQAFDDTMEQLISSIQIPSIAST